ncbi:unnamed protein product [Orchesella dallaii]|uniref:Haloacid dehalogenase-like hydrolase domain-containing protein 2 n=1 Tax=Orchesella dallaii TaxID=48710 RepID=A0ABP1QIP5_9HEXA
MILKMFRRTSFLTNKVINEWDNRIQCFFIDLSGTVHVDKELIPGAINAFEKLKKTQTKFKFVTNTSKEAVSTTVQNLDSLGLQLSKQEVYSSLTATRDYLIRNNLRPHLLVADEALEEFEGLDTNDPNTVVVGLAPMKFNYKELNECFRILMKPENKIVAINKGRYYKTRDGMSLGAGPFVFNLEFATSKEATIVGKPSKEFFINAMKSVGHEDPSTCVMIGDDVNDDVMGAIEAGMHGCLVKTGKYRPGDEDKLFSVGGDPEPYPAKERCLVANTLEDAINLLLP